MHEQVQATEPPKGNVKGNHYEMKTLAVVAL